MLLLCISWVTGLRPRRVTLLLAATEPLAAEALLRRTCWELLEEGLDVAAEELLRTTWPFWEPEVALLRVAELLRVTELEEELLRVAEPEELLPEVVVPLRTWLDWVGAVADRVEEELEEERTALEELLRVWLEVELLRVAEPVEVLRPVLLCRVTCVALERVGLVEELRTALEELLRVAELVELLRTAEDLLLDEELPEVVVVLRPVEEELPLRRV